MRTPGKWQIRTTTQRRKPTEAWKTYGRYAGNTTTAFDTGIAALGNREYRLFVPAHPARHARVDVWAKIQPAATVRGTLQVLLKGKWNNVFPVQVTNGSMLQHANTGADRGPYTYRITLPAITVNGLTLSATSSSPFPITIG